MDDSLDKTLDEELLSLCASFNSLRYSSPDDMNGTGVTRSALWKDIGDVQLVISTQDSGNGNKYVDYILFLKLLSGNNGIHNVNLNIYMYIILYNMCVECKKIFLTKNPLRTKMAKRTFDGPIDHRVG